jgi:hypothetical protein
MTTVVSVSGGINSAYNLWNAAKNSNGDIIAVHVDIKSYAISVEFEANNYPKGVSLAANGVVSWINANVKPITYHYLTLDNYTPQYSTLGFLEVANYSLSLANVQSVILSDGVESTDKNSVAIRAAAEKIANNVSFPLINQNFSVLNCIEALPADLLALCHKNQYYKGIVAMKAASKTNQEILDEINNIIGNGPTPYQKMLNYNYTFPHRNNTRMLHDNKYFCDESSYFGSIEFEYPVKYLAPHLKIFD